MVTSQTPTFVLTFLASRLDASTLGKIDIQGSDASEFLNRVYTNAWSKLSIGKCRYGLMLNEDGMVYDDGVTTRSVSYTHLTLPTIFRV